MKRFLLLLLAALAPIHAQALSDREALELLDRARGGNAAALEDLRRAAEAGDAPVQRDDAAAARWVEKAAEQGHREAQNNIGYLYSAGQGVPRDTAKTISWWTRAADAGFVQAQFNLAIAYLQGKLTAKDDAKAFGRMSKAAAQGNAIAQANLADFYRRGTGTAPSMRDAATWYRKAAEQGNSTAAFNLAAILERGDGVARDPAEALHWARRAAARGNADAASLEARLCRDNTGLCERNPAPHFVFELSEPRLRIVIPDAPPMKMGPHPLAATTPHARAMGSAEGGYSISVLTPTSDAGLSPMQCANSLGHGGTHCVEVHLSKIVRSKSEVQPWFDGFAGARIEPY